MGWSGSTFTLTDGTYTEPGICQKQAADGDARINANEVDAIFEDLSGGLNECLLKDASNADADWTPTHPAFKADLTGFTNFNSNGAGFSQSQLETPSLNEGYTLGSGDPVVVPATGVYHAVLNFSSTYIASATPDPVDHDFSIRVNGLSEPAEAEKVLQFDPSDTSPVTDGGSIVAILNLTAGDEVFFRHGVGATSNNSDNTITGTAALYRIS